MLEKFQVNQKLLTLFIQECALGVVRNNQTGPYHFISIRLSKSSLIQQYWILRDALLKGLCHGDFHIFGIKKTEMVIEYLFSYMKCS